MKPNFRSLLMVCLILFMPLAGEEPPDPPAVTWLGHAFMKFVTPEGTVVVVDPWPENPKFPADAELDRVDYILVTHGHFDHLGGAAALAQKTDAQVICIFEVGNYLQRQGLPSEQVWALNKGGTITADGIAFTMVTAVHSSGISLEDHAMAPGGSPAGFVIRFANGFTIYDTGDSDVFGDMALIQRRFHPDLLILPIGGYYTMDPVGAAEACRLVQPRWVFPNHYGTFPILAGTPDALKRELADHPEIQILDRAPGQTWP
jgi:L-ascorbate metabolism protein UlaG (beta-lactamase superfamily)